MAPSISPENAPVAAPAGMDGTDRMAGSTGREKSSCG
ncbi:MAG: hypothetical protein BWX47_01746 [candidate division Hyd24-12 bacterium ADurb.Bin004]|nr:MAG: hypothetical protein BWX47_01746 [candidate division Hyd24-12 bacterium ADurb.Bin004]